MQCERRFERESKERATKVRRIDGAPFSHAPSSYEQRRDSDTSLLVPDHFFGGVQSSVRQMEGDFEARPIEVVNQLSLDYRSAGERRTRIGGVRRIYC